MNIEFFRHNIGQQEIRKVNKVLKSIFLTTGPVTQEFEDKLAHYIGCQKVVAVSSCTAALFLSLKACDIGPGDEVITTPMTFIATPNAVLQTGAKPVFVDVEEHTGNINANLIEKAITPRTKAIIPVHLYGQMCDMKKIKKIADAYRLFVIEDAAHAIEAKRDGIRVGQLGDFVCFSFYATKNITCGEGGAVGTSDEKAAEKINKLKLHGMNKGAAERYVHKYRHWDMELLGWKFNLDDIHAALLINQIPKIEKFWRRREKICQIYETNLKNIRGIELMTVLPNSQSARHLFTILTSPKKRDQLLWNLQEKGIGVAVNYRAVHLLQYYRKTFGYRRGSFPVAEKIGGGTVSIPLYPKLTNSQINYIIQAIKEIAQNMPL